MDSAVANIAAFPREAFGVCNAVDDLSMQDFRPEVLRAALLLRHEEQRELFALARRVRDSRFPSRGVEVRSVVEVSNICRQKCRYCNMAANSGRKGYVLQEEALLGMAQHLHAKGRRVVMIQSGENGSQSFVNHVCRCVAALKRSLPDMEVILCLGNLGRAQYRQLREAGADRYILKFETSNVDLYAECKPRDTLQNRLKCLHNLRELGFEMGSGNMVGLPGQTLDDIVSDLLLAARLELRMVSCSVFIPGEASEYSEAPIGDIDLALNTLALMRIMAPDRLIPSVSAFERARKGGQYLALMAGANTVTIHDGTPDNLKQMFPIYSVKRFTPTIQHLRQAVSQAGLRFPEDE